MLFVLFVCCSWEPQRHGNIGRIDLQVREMWMPDIIFFTQLSGEHFNEGFPSPPALLNNGITMVLKPFKAELVCVMDAWYFPYDEQVFTHFHFHPNTFQFRVQFHTSQNYLQFGVKY